MAGQERQGEEGHFPGEIRSSLEKVLYGEKRASVLTVRRGFGLSSDAPLPHCCFACALQVRFRCSVAEGFRSDVPLSSSQEQSRSSAMAIGAEGFRSDVPLSSSQEQSRSSAMAIGAEQGVVFWLCVLSTALLALLVNMRGGAGAQWADAVLLLISVLILSWGWGGGIMVRHVMLQQRIELKSE